jgi:hypothetical protein
VILLLDYFSLALGSFSWLFVEAFAYQVFDSGSSPASLGDGSWGYSFFKVWFGLVLL